MLTGVFLKNFQTIKEPTFIRLDKLCLLYGPNSAGKSSVLDAINLIKDTVSNSDDYSREHLFRKNSNEIFSGCSVGMEFTGRYLKGERKDVDLWWETPDRNGEYIQQYLFDKLIDKKIQIEFSDGGNSIKVAVEGSPLFEINGISTNYDHFFKRDLGDNKYGEDSESIYDDRFIYGQLVIYKSNPLNKLYDFEYSDFSTTRVGAQTFVGHSKSYFLDLFAEETDTTLKINGIIFSADKDWQTSLVGVHFGVEDPLFSELDQLQNKSVREQDKSAYIDFIESEYGGDAATREKKLNSRRLIFSSLENIAKDFDTLVQGFFYQIQMATDFSHVRGDRQVLDSNKCFSYDQTKKLKIENSVGDNDGYMARYARYASDNQAYQVPKPNMDFDFVNFSLEKYMPSLRGYRIEPETYVLKDPAGELHKDNQLIYLNVKNKTDKLLGFQDVGSGISYVFPILASLWSSKLNIVEQPELHLHPSAQCELGDVFIAALNKKSLALVESHSEHMLLRLLRRIRETTKGYLMPKELNFTNEDLVVYYFKPEPEGHTSVKEIRVDKHGELLTPWPGGFFSERDRELFDE